MTLRDLRRAIGDIHVRTSDGYGVRAAALTIMFNAEHAELMNAKRERESLMTPTANLNGPLPAPMGIPLEQLIEDAVKRAKYLALVEMARTVNAFIEELTSDEGAYDYMPLLRPEIFEIIRTAAGALGVPVPMDARQ